MKRILINGFFAGVALLAVPSVFAQEKAETKKKDIQQIIITRTGDVDVKTVIEIKGDNITVNGKPVQDAKDSDVKVRVQKIKDATAYAPGNFNLNFDELQVLGDIDHNNAMSLFSEDENRAMLGVVTEKNSKGAIITSISKESGAEKAGLKKNDIITKVDETKIVGTGDVSDAIRKHKPGEKVTVTFLRDNKEQKVTAELGKWTGIKMNAMGDNFRVFTPDVWEGPRVPYTMGYGGAPRLGLSVQDTEDGKGVTVMDVDEDSNAAKAGVKEKDIITHVNNEAVNSADEIAKKIRANKDKTSFQLKVLRNGKVQNIEVKTPRKLKTADL